jgi:hypothetical protein
MMKMTRQPLVITVIAHIIPASTGHNMPSLAHLRGLLAPSSVLVAMLLAGLWVAAADCANAVGQESDPFLQEEEQLRLTKTEKIAEALSFTTMRNHQRAMELLRELSVAYPDDTEVQFQYYKSVKARATQLVSGGKRSEGYELYKRAGELLRKLDLQQIPEESRPRFMKLHSDTFYNEACTYAVEGDTESCLSSLGEARRWGFDNLNHMLNDLDLLDVVDTQAFRDMLGEDLVTYMTALKETARERMEKFAPLDFELELPDLQGRTINIADLRGKVLILSFWATGNRISGNNLKMLVRLKRNLPEAPFEVIIVGCERTNDAEEATAQLSEYISENDIPFACLVADPRVRAKMKETRGFPATILLDDNGQVRAAFTGAFPYHVLQTCVEIMLENDREPPGEGD